MIDIFPVDTGHPGRLAVALRPRGGDWLEDELRGLVRAKVGVLVSMLTKEEERELDLIEEERIAVHSGLEFIRIPVADRGVPSLALLLPIVLRLAGLVRSGGSVVVHCRQGIGRSSLTVAATLVALGMDPTAAWSEVAKARGRPVPDTDEQRQWLHSVHLALAGSHPGSAG